jgi:hypothetical protein
MCLIILHAFSQVAPGDTSSYKPRALKFDEAEIVSSYYNQTADKSAVSGGQTGPMANADVTDLANGIEIHLVGWDKRHGKITRTAGIGYDYHTAASQAWVSKTGASRTSGLQIGLPLPGQDFGDLGLRETHRLCQLSLIHLVLE